MTHEQHFLAYSGSFPPVRQGTILNTIESSVLLPIPQQCYLRLWPTQLLQQG